MANCRDGQNRKICEEKMSCRGWQTAGMGRTEKDVKKRCPVMDGKLQGWGEQKKMSDDARYVKQMSNKAVIHVEMLGQ